MHADHARTPSGSTSATVTATITVTATVTVTVPDAASLSIPVNHIVDGACSFTNNSAFKAASTKQINVKLNDYAACCAACKADTACHAAAMTHGPRSADYDFCVMYSEQAKATHADSSCPLLAVTMVPSP